jgi:subtilase family serine protease
MKIPSLAAGVAIAYVCCAGQFFPSASAAAPLQAAAPSDQVQFDVYMPLRNSQALDTLLDQLHDPSSPNFRHWLTPAQFMNQFGPSSADMAKMQASLTAHGLSILKTTAHGFHVSGTAAAVQAVFGTQLKKTGTALGATRFVAQGALTLPREVSGSNARIVSLGSVPVQRTHSRSVGPVPDNRYSNFGGYWFDDLKQAYDFPSYQELSGHGSTIAIVMSSDFQDSDIAMYFNHEGLNPPHIERVPVCIDEGPPVGTLCGAPFGGINDSASDEVSLDLEQSAGMAPHAHIKLYNIPDLSDTSVLTAYQEIIDDNSADIVSSSFGCPEACYFASYNGGVDFTYILDQYRDLFRQGNAQGITFVASSGDDGGLPIPSANYFYPDGNPVTWVPGVDHPASNPNVTGVGGTNLITTTPPNPQTTPPTLTSKYVFEHAFGDPEIPYDPYGVGINVPGGWWGSGGGTSQYFNKPLYQYFLETGAHMRTVPDISLMMGGCPGGISELPCPPPGALPRSYVIVAVDGGFYGFIGTSVSAPGTAGILALEEENLGGVRLGNVNYQIYTQAGLPWGFDGGVFHTDIRGFNGYDVATGHGNYNKVLGVGTPDVRKFIFAPFTQPAGTPQSPSNP